jgi:membrane fusion protein (multidrug efflux system)
MTGNMNRSLYHSTSRKFFIILLLAALFNHANAKSPQPVPKVLVSIAEQTALIEEIPVSGTVISPRVSELALEVSGIISSVAVDVGDNIQLGDDLLRLDAELHKLSLAVSRAASEQAREQMADTRRRLSDLQSLAKKHSVSENELQSLAAQVRIDSAALEGFLAEHKRQQALLRRHTLAAPFAGVISHKYVEKGEWVQPGKAVFRLVDTNNLRLDFQVPQSVFSKLDQVTEVTVTLDSLPQQNYRGQIEAVVPVSNPDSRSFMIRVALNNTQVSMAPGMSASAVLRLQHGTQGIVVPRDALLRYPDGRVTVWVLKQQGNEMTVEEQQVQTGLSFDSKITITGGLQGGEQVVVQGNEALRDGQPVSVQSGK